MTKAELVAYLEHVPDDYEILVLESSFRWKTLGWTTPLRRSKWSMGKGIEIDAQERVVYLGEKK